MMHPLDIAAALDPTRSTAVEACAGSGKTWLLVSRMLRLLLAGAALIGRSVLKLGRVSPGFAIDGLIAGRVNFPAGKYDAPGAAVVG
mgnify:CR=1 FL=1